MAHDILIVDDEADIRSLTSSILEDEGYQTRGAGNSTEALAAIEQRRPSLMLLDVWLQGSELDGLDILKIVAEQHPLLPVVIMSGHGTIESAVAAIKDGAYDFIEKPFTTDRLVLAIERGIEAMRLRRENEELRLRAGTETELLGQSQPINHLRQLIERVAPTNSRVLISGAGGVGQGGRRAHAACPFAARQRSVHRRQLRQHGPRPGGDGTVRGSSSRATPRAPIGGSACSRQRITARCCSTAVNDMPLGDPGQDRPGASGTDLRTHRRRDPGRGGRSGRGVDQRRSFGGDQRGGLSARTCSIG